mgnify:CR=1 FL=1
MPNKAPDLDWDGVTAHPVPAMASRTRTAPCFVCKTRGVLEASGGLGEAGLASACPACSGAGKIDAQLLIDALTSAGFGVL